MGLAQLGEHLVERGVGLEAIGLETVLDHAIAAERHDGALERRIGLQADDLLEILGDVAGPVGCDGRGVETSTSNTPPLSRSALS
jgi:hypothetical protein